MGDVFTLNGGIVSVGFFRVSKEEPCGRFKTLQVTTRRRARLSAYNQINKFMPSLKSVWGLFRNKRCGRQRPPRRDIRAFVRVNIF
jgi:hypothetical protein